MNRALAGSPSIAGTGVFVAVALSLLGLVVRAANAPLWPSMLTDWSAGSALLATSSAVVGVVIVARLPRHPVGWLFLIIGVLTGVVFATREVTTLGLSAAEPAGWVDWTAWACSVAIPVNMTCLTLVTLVFPHGVAVSRRWRHIVGIVAVIGTGTAVTTALSPFGTDFTPFPQARNPVAVFQSAAAVNVFAELLLLGQLAGVVSLVVRLRRSDGVEHQQVKWFCFAGVLATLALIAGFWSEPIFVAATLVGLPAVPVAAAMAILRYRLYDIDRLIGRTVAYTVLTLVLAGVYVAGITSIRFVTDPLTGDSAVAVAASTLAAAALFRPLRTRLQDAVDRRFNRARYDAAATAESLRLRFRDELDLRAIEVELLGTVCATMAPAGTALWLRETER